MSSKLIRWGGPAMTIIVTIPLESVAPEYMTVDLPFLVVGLVLAMVGCAVLRSRGDAKEPTNRPLAADVQSS